MRDFVIFCTVCHFGYERIYTQGQDIGNKVGKQMKTKLCLAPIHPKWNEFPPESKIKEGLAIKWYIMTFIVKNP